MTGDRTPTPYWEDDHVQLYLGDMREILPALGVTADLVVADPPYGQTHLHWDQWPPGWPTLVAKHASALWCFGTARMFFDRLSEFADWRLAQDIVWRKNTATSVRIDRFRRHHELVLHWYRGTWTDQYHALPKVPSTLPAAGQRRRDGGDGSTRHTDGPSGARVLDNHFGLMDTPWSDDGARYMTSVIDAAKAPHRGRINATQKPVDLLRPLIEYACPPGGLVLDPFAGSGSTLEAARLTGRKAIGIERHEPYAQAAAKRLAQAPLEIA